MPKYILPTKAHCAFLFVSKGDQARDKNQKMNTSNEEIIRIAKSYADVAGRHEPNGHDFMTASVAAGVAASDVRAAADVAMTVWTNAQMVGGGKAETLADRAAKTGAAGKKARALMASGKYTGRETLSNLSGRWELSK